MAAPPSGTHLPVATRRAEPAPPPVAAAAACWELQLPGTPLPGEDYSSQRAPRARGGAPPGPALHFPAGVGGGGQSARLRLVGARSGVGFRGSKRAAERKRRRGSSA
ncbi:unnamed protein product, partial [Bubo scandiacus]